MENREIEFRAWGNKRNIMITNSVNEYSEEPYNHYIFALFDRKPVLLYFDKIDEDDYVVVDAVIMQYVGLKDKNGLKIFEGDIVRKEEYRTYNSDGTLCEKPDFVNQGIVTYCIEDASYHCLYYPLVWENIWNGKVIQTIESNYCNRHFKLEMNREHYNELEVIGNIYENKELLKAGRRP